MYTYTIKVTASNIQKGLRDSCDSCPIARALRREFGGIILVTAVWIRIHNEYISTPDKICDFIYNFDHDKDVEPFSFELTTKKEYIKKGK